MFAMFASLCAQLKAFRREERGAVDIVAIVVMIGIAVALAVIFRTQIQGLLENLFGTISSNATSAIE